MADSSATTTPPKSKATSSSSGRVTLGQVLECHATVAAIVKQVARALDMDDDTPYDAFCSRLMECMDKICDGGAAAKTDKLQFGDLHNAHKALQTIKWELIHSLEGKGANKAFDEAFKTDAASSKYKGETPLSKLHQGLPGSIGFIETPQEAATSSSAAPAEAAAGGGSTPPKNKLTPYTLICKGCRKPPFTYNGWCFCSSRQDFQKGTKFQSGCTGIIKESTVLDLEKAASAAIEAFKERQGAQKRARMSLPPPPMLGGAASSSANAGAAAGGGGGMTKTNPFSPEEEEEEEEEE